MKTNLLLLLFLVLLVLVPMYGQSGVSQLSDNLELIQLTQNCYLHISYYDLESVPHCPANGMVFIDHGEACIIDTPWRDEETNLLIDWIEKELRAKVTGCVVNHWHIDCMGGLAAVHQAGIASYSHAETRQIARTKMLPLPENTFTDSLIIPVGRKQLVCKYLGAAHTVDNIVVWQPDDKILFAGCMVKALEQHNLGYTGDSDLEAYPLTLKKMLAVFPDCRIVIPGHGKIGDTRLITHTISLFDNNQ